MSKIFISYRRDDTGAFVDRLYEALDKHLPDHEIFRDVGGIKMSEDWVDKLRDEISNSQVVLVVIGKKWLQADSRGRRRIDNPKDILRRELEWAHKKHVLIAPVLAAGARMPREDEMPAELKFLHRLQAERIRDESFDEDIDALAKRLLQLFEQAARETQEANDFLDELMDMDGELEFIPGAVLIDDFAIAGTWHCEVKSSIANDPGFNADGRATIRFRIPAEGGTFKGTWKSEREFRIEGNWMIGAGDSRDPHRVTSLRLDGVLDGVDHFAWEIPIAERTGDGYRGVDAQGRHYFLRLTRPAKTGF